MSDKAPLEARKNGGEAQKTSIVWDDSAMRMSYANVVNVTSTREELTLFFGVNHTWDARDEEFRVSLTDRIVLNPFAAKRLLALLANVLTEYEKRYGRLDTQARPSGAAN
jgi:hypothetical protein